LEKNDKVGNKLSITGKGRCNFTNSCDPENLLANTVGNPEFLYSAFYGFTSEDTIRFFRELGVESVVERGRRVFPKSQKAADIVNAMASYLRRNSVEVILNSEVNNIKIISSGRHKWRVTAHGRIYEADSLIVATGGLSYPATGSTGDGYKFAKLFGHNITKLTPSLVPLKTKEDWVRELPGLSLHNIAITLSDLSNRRKVLYKDFGELLFTHYGISGPVVLSASRFVSGDNNVFSIDLKPALDLKALNARILRDFTKYNNKRVINALDDLLPRALIPIVIKLAEIPFDKSVHDITKAERKNLAAALKSVKLTLAGRAGFNEAVITNGGVDTGEIDPSTMESKIIPGLFFVGEVLDVDALTGGYNLQIAFSTGYLAGIHC
ncbi:MAG: NAD(P)/FAD-dependent oxidoreductase, partial [Clostridiales bacterium]|nr:NAD(P)/FAD-dependent oxidoreductase [Clostridiales bacterium]